MSDEDEDGVTDTVDECPQTDRRWWPMNSDVRQNNSMRMQMG